jgi:hypothetical protein
MASATRRGHQVITSGCVVCMRRRVCVSAHGRRQALFAHDGDLPFSGRSALWLIRMAAARLAPAGVQALVFELHRVREQVGALLRRRPARTTPGPHNPRNDARDDAQQLAALPRPGNIQGDGARAAFGCPIMALAPGVLLAEQEKVLPEGCRPRACNQVVPVKAAQVRACCWEGRDLDRPSTGASSRRRWCAAARLPCGASTSMPLTLCPSWCARRPTPRPPASPAVEASPGAPESCPLATLVRTLGPCREAVVRPISRAVWRHAYVPAFSSRIRRPDHVGLAGGAPRAVGAGGSGSRAAVEPQECYRQKGHGTPHERLPLPSHRA